MHRLLLILLLAFVTAAWAQDSDQAEPEQAADTTETAADDEISAAEDDESLDDIELYPVEDEDEFIPSENVKFGQSIPFPTDI